MINQNFEIIYDAEVLKFNSYDYNDANNLGRGEKITVAHTGTQVVFKIVRNWLNVWIKLIEQQLMMLMT